MARIGIVNCSNSTQEMSCASVVCLADMRKRRDFFEKYSPGEQLDLVGIISCAGCPTLAAPEKILRKVRAIAEFRQQFSF
ncbi:CGGC domain-containing protein [Desulfoferrobacter suflitae]|uniref:CGGC domain-containing protein n=1 Tax=Desulfoferrobacter suflitae TaxID=2865782 RepID=UPI00339020F1